MIVYELSQDGGETYFYCFQASHASSNDVFSNDFLKNEIPKTVVDKLDKFAFDYGFVDALSNRTCV